jgi:Ser/Thr protein kinase RdoA (MazF antagonist)
MNSPLDILPESERLAAFDNLAEHALASWKVSPHSIRRIACRENAVYDVLTEQGRRVLRVHRHGYHTKASLHSEFVWMKALISVGVETAHVIPTPAGESIVEVSTAQVPVPHLCDMLEWVEGRPLGRAEDPSAMVQEEVFNRYRIVGRIAAQIHRHSMQWEPPIGFVRPHWDREGCLGRGALWGPWQELASLTDDDRNKLSAAAAKVDQVLHGLGQHRGVYGLVHADFVPENLFENEGRIIVLDLDDAGYGWYLWELVTAVFWYLGTAHYTAALDGYVTGYRALLPLSDEHLQLVPHFLLMRALVYMGWMQTRQSQRTARVFTGRVRELSLALADRVLRGETDHRHIPLQLTPLPDEA